MEYTASRVVEPGVMFYTIFSNYYGIKKKNNFIDLSFSGGNMALKATRSICAVCEDNNIDNITKGVYQKPVSSVE